MATVGIQPAEVTGATPVASDVRPCAAPKKARAPVEAGPSIS